MRLCCLVVLLAGLLPAAVRAESVPVGNPGFEELMTPGSPQPRHWRPASGNTPLATDPGTAYEGERSLRLDHQPPFVGSAQSVDARPWRGRMLVLRARLRGGGLGTGDVGLWLRGNKAEGGITGFATSYRSPLRGDTDWELREVRLFVSQDTERLVFGAALGAPGTLWVDAVELQAIDNDEQAAPSNVARKYLDDALAIIEQNAYFSARVDWVRLRGEVDTIAAGATTPEDTYEAIAYALAALGDGHSHFVTPRRSEQLASSRGDEPAAGIRAKQLGRVGYLRVPGFASTHAESGIAFARALRGHLDEQAAAGACGWIIDLRGNTGGNMYPMIHGLSGLLGGDTLGYFVGLHGREAWNAKRAGSANGELHALPLGATAPVAVLQGHRTSSSGEAVLLSFIGRANTRRFGEPSEGLSTANRVFVLDDGAGIALTTALMADRSGKAYGGKISPDEVLPGEDAAETAGRQWIEAQAGCVG
jgi:C-terminal processing protease CtpA/Prc